MLEALRKWLMTDEVFAVLGAYTRQPGVVPDAAFHERFVADLDGSEGYEPGTEPEPRLVVDYMLRWLLDDDARLRLLLAFTAKRLAPRGTREDAEDALHDFLVNQLAYVVSKFDPARGTFLGLFFVSYGNFLSKWVKRLRSRPPLLPDEAVEEAPEYSDLDALLAEWSDLAPRGALPEAIGRLPRHHLLRLLLADGLDYPRAKIDALPQIAAAKACSNPRFAVFDLFVLLNYKHAEIADILRISVPNSAVRLHLSKQTLKRIVEGKP